MYQVYKKYKTNNETPREENECYALADYLNLKKIRFSHISNESGMRLPWGVIVKRKKMGYGAGIPDYIVCLPKILLFIEMKRVKGGIVSQEQKDWQTALNNYTNVKSIIAYGFDEAKKIIDKYA